MNNWAEMFERCVEEWVDEMTNWVDEVTKCGQASELSGQLCGFRGQGDRCGE